ncbi:hypothetical protein [Actinosynnema sp. NPDC020468]|uniref:hypothetical protein n=1 Tax=Actinosynnema sp. NPDC020468 TaxID=3154488 RepID=UPI0033CA7978
MPPKVPQPDVNYPAYPHAALRSQVVDDFAPDRAGEIAQAWHRLGAAFTDFAVDFSVIVNGSHDGWTGRAAEGAREALRRIGAFADATGDQFTAIGAAVDRQTSAAVEARTRMPEPVDYDPRLMLGQAAASGNLLTLLALPITMPGRKALSDAAKARAEEVVRARDDAMLASATELPTFAAPPRVGHERELVGGTTTTASVTTGTATPPPTVGTVPTARPGTPLPPASPVLPTVPTSPTSPPDPTAAVPTPAVVPRPSWTPTPRPTPEVPAFEPEPSLSSPDRSGTSTASGAADHVPGTRGGSAFAGHAAVVPGGTIAPGGPPEPGFGPVPGRTSAIAPGGSAAARGVGSAGAGRVARPGGPGPVGGPPGPVEREEDREHAAKYLVPTDEYFDDDRLVAPQTIGEE